MQQFLADTLTVKLVDALDHSEARARAKQNPSLVLIAHQRELSLLCSLIGLPAENLVADDLVFAKVLHELPLDNLAVLVLL